MFIPFLAKKFTAFFCQLVNKISQICQSFRRSSGLVQINSRQGLKIIVFGGRVDKGFKEWFPKFSLLCGLWTTNGQLGKVCQLISMSKLITQWVGQNLLSNCAKLLISVGVTRFFARCICRNSLEVLFFYSLAEKIESDHLSVLFTTCLLRSARNSNAIMLFFGHFEVAFDKIATKS